MAGGGGGGRVRDGGEGDFGCVMEAGSRKNEGVYGCGRKEGSREKSVSFVPGDSDDITTRDLAWALSYQI